MKSYKKITIIFISIILLGCDSKNKHQSDFILEQRPDNQSCVAGKALPINEQSIEVQAIDLPETLALSSVTVLKQNLQVDNSWYLVQQKGVIYKLNHFGNNATANVYLDIQNQVFDETSNEQGLVGLAFHRDFINYPHIFVYYTAVSATSLSGTEVRISRFVEEGGLINPSSEEILIRYDKDIIYHHAGTLEIGPDGYLYISVGDDVANTNGVWNLSTNSQNKFSLKGKMLRIDIAGASGYSIPVSNPFASGVEGAPEVFALGFRNPWKYSFDLSTNDLWLGDVGRVGAEEINKIESANNYGWPKMEGHRCYSGNVCTDFSVPYVSFSRSDKNCIIGGYVYRGSEIESLQGQYLSGDCFYGGIWQSDVYGEKTQNNVATKLLFDSHENITTFAEDENKEIYFSAVSGKVFKIVAKDIPANDQEFTIKEKLSDTTCVNMKAPDEPSPATIAYKIRFPFWSDNAEKNRFIALPNTASIQDFAKNGDDYYQPYTYDLPIGTVLIKNFKVNGKMIETRLLAHHENNEWRGYSYEWNKEQNEAILLEDSKLKTLDNGEEYYFPSPTDCLTCHTNAAHKVLGFNPYQLNLTLKNNLKEEHQLSYLKRLGIDLTPETILPEKFSDHHEKNNAEWVKSYLHSNCAFCHQEGGPIDLGMDFRFTQDLEHLNNKSPIVDDFGIKNAKIIAPNNPHRSILLNRISRKDEQRMPFIGNLLKDEEAIERVTDYINSL